MAKKTLVLVIEDNRLVRDGLATLLDAQPDFKVVAAAEDANVGLRQLRETKPHVVLVDATLGNQDSRRVVESVRNTAPEARVIVMDFLAAREDVIAFIKAGAHGFIVKDATAADVVSTIRSVAEGDDVVPDALTPTLLSHIVGQAVRPKTPVLDSPSIKEGVRMTAREREVIDLVTDGLSDKEIAQRLKLAPHTVRNYVRRILEKVALHSRLQLAVLARKAGAPEANRRTPPLTDSPATKKPQDPSS
jgi:DNA-binding NarL/FixJ family response regulator